MYYAQYLRMFEQTRTLFMEDCGLSLLELADQNCLFVCRRAEVDYQHSAKFGDNLVIRTGIAELSHCFVTFAYDVICSNRLDPDGNPLPIAEGITQMAAVSEREGRSAVRKIPKFVSAALADRKE